MIHIRKIFKNKYVLINKQRYFFLLENSKRYVIPDKCPHRGGPLSLGNICRESQTLQCPWHDNIFTIINLIKKNVTAIRIQNELFYVA